MTPEEKICKWITEKTLAGRGAIVFSLEESAGYIGVWAGEGCDGPALGYGESATEAVLMAARSEAAQPTLAPDLPSAVPGCKCFVSIESYNACPVHGTANR